jgi:hypothetical protein
MRTGQEMALGISIFAVPIAGPFVLSITVRMVISVDFTGPSFSKIVRHLARLVGCGVRGKSSKDSRYPAARS